MEKTYNAQFLAPFNMVVSGGSYSGKSEWVFRLITHAKEMIQPNVDLIYYCYKEYSDRFNDIKGVTFFQGFEESIISKENLKSKSCLLILDDLMCDINEKILLDLFLVYSHHRSVYPIFICHSLYHSGLKCNRTISLSTTYNVIMKSNRDKSSIRVLASQMFPGQVKWFVEAFSYATRDNFSYIVVDSRSTQADELRVRTRVFPGEDMICFIPNIKAS